MNIRKTIKRKLRENEEVDVGGGDPVSAIPDVDKINRDNYQQVASRIKSAIENYASSNSDSSLFYSSQIGAYQAVLDKLISDIAIKK